MILAPVGPPAITLAAVSDLIDMQSVRVMLMGCRSWKCAPSLHFALRMSHC
jgi:hypothetical protein